MHVLTAMLVPAALLVAPAVAPAFDGCGSANSTAHVRAMKAGEADIVDTALAAGQFNTLAKALAAAELVDALRGEGPFTVFAPTDAAFAKIPEKVLADLLRPERKSDLQAILTYHVVPGAVTADKVVKLTSADTLSGQRLDLKVVEGVVMVDGAKVVTTDIKCANGVIHVIDTVVMPQLANLVDTAKDAGAFQTLVAALGAAELAEVIGTKGPFTVFAPTDEAFAALPAGTVESLLLPENKARLQEILKLHVVSGRVYSDQALRAGRAETLQGSELTIRVDAASKKAFVGDAGLSQTDIEARNGVIHVIDRVLLPK